MKRWHPRFCTPLQRFGSILRVWDILGSSKSEKKQRLGNHVFWNWKERSKNRFSYDFRVIFGAILEVPNHCKIIKLDFTLCFVVWGFPGSVLGPLLRPFWGHFGVTFDVVWAVFRWCFRVLVRGVVSSCFNLERGRGRAAGAAEDHMKCKKRSGIHLARALLLNALPVPLLRQVYFLVFFLSFFQLVFWGSFFQVFQFLGASGGPKGGHFWNMFVKKNVF